MTSTAPTLLQRHLWRDVLHLRPLTLSALVIAFIFCAYNASFWHVAAVVFSGHPLSMVGYMAALFLLTLAPFSLFAFPWVVKPFLVFIVLLCSVTSYYVDTLGVFVDRDMIQNAMVTTFAESKHLITPGFIFHVLILGVLPSVLIGLVRIRRQGRMKTFAMPLVIGVVSLAVALGLLMVDLKSYSSILRERKDLMLSYQPGAPVVGMIRYARMMTQSSNVAVAPIGADAVKGPSYAVSRKPLLTIVVAGETARSQNFSLNGYDVPTNPELAKLPVVSFADVSSCGTATAVSLPCMFSNFTRATYSHKNGRANENVLDVLHHAGFNVEWWDNNTGDKMIAARIPSRSFTHTENAEFCASGECMDGIFMAALKDYADTVTEDTVLVLHQAGSHGPTYYLRYPENFEPFKPACRTAEFKNCTPEEITRAYDNTIAYTDKILADTIRMLDGEGRLDTALLYVSDHGESLGEGGLYLHGSPYFMAPEYQTKVPMILWMSQGFGKRFGIDGDCVADKKGDTLSHDNLFHSLIGMLDVRTDAHDPGLDIFATCMNAKEIASK